MSEMSVNNSSEEAGTVNCETDLSKAELPVLLVLTILLDGVSIFVLVRIRPAVNTIHHFLVTTLAANDLVTTLLFTVMWIGCVTVCGKIGGDLGCSLLGWCATAMVIWSAWVVVVMSGVRYLAVVKPLFYRIHVSFRSVRVGLLLTSVFTFVILSLPFTGLVEPYKLYTENYICAYNFAPGAGGVLHRVMLGVISGLGLLTFVPILFFNSRIVWEIRVMYDVVHNSQNQDGVRHSLTMFPLFLSPLINPFIYAVSNKHYRQYVVDTLRNGLGKCGLRIRPDQKTAHVPK